MKILHVIHDHPMHPKIGGGGAVRVHEIARRLAARGHEIHLVSGWFEGCEAHGGATPGIQTTFLGTRRLPAARAAEFALAAGRALPRLARDADIVIEDFSPYAPVGAFRLETPKRPVWLQIQNYAGGALMMRHGLFGLPLRAIERVYPGFFSRHLLVGEHLRKRFKARHTAVVPMGYTAPEPLTGPAEGSREFIGFLGRIDFNQKGLDSLLAALEGVDLPIRFAGAGPDTPRLEAALARLPNARYLGKLAGAEKWRFLREARFLVMPSRFEGQPVVAIEAAAAGTPLLASAIPELDFITEAGIGRQLPDASVAALTRGLETMWREAGRPDFRVAAARFASDRTWDNIAIQFEAELARGRTAA